MEVIYNLLETILPIDLIQYTFMKNAFLAILLVSPIFAIIGTMVVNKKMAFFSDALGHSAFTGIAIGMLLGMTNMNISMIIFAIIFALLLNFIKDKTTYGSDTIISVFSSIAIALGLAILSKNGNFNKSKGINVKLMENIFAVLIAIMVMISIKWVGILLINSLIILPAASSRNVSMNMRSYHLLSIAFALFSGIAGLVISYYTNIPTGPMIVIILGIIYFLTFAIKKTNILNKFN